MSFLSRWFDCIRPSRSRTASASSSSGTNTKSSTIRNDYNIFCVRCAQPVNDYDAKRSVLARGRIYHSTHFSCALCDCSIMQGYLPHPSDPKEVVCSDCHCKITNPPCAGCGVPLGQRVSRAQDKLWHHDCLRCSRCNRILGKKYADVDGRLLHETCLIAQLHTKLPVEIIRKAKTVSK